MSAAGYTSSRGNPALANPAGALTDRADGVAIPAVWLVDEPARTPVLVAHPPRGLLPANRPGGQP